MLPECMKSYMATAVVVNSKQKPFLMAIINPDVDTFVSAGIAQHGRFDSHVVAVFSFVLSKITSIGDAVVVDVGANVGFMSAFAASHVPCVCIRTAKPSSSLHSSGSLPQWLGQLRGGAVACLWQRFDQSPR